ncbi:uncharacterized protein HKW66_Vig0185990 [Vigna angularis]|uniref:Uncharacterized protein n=1 Tax=Phaseolus angularis TaxID=3914 RepID=A0A8T0KVY0_PHAAN|nr:uncharacterized protein HKW66_Vig0185990 [Vigna angularis]
MGDEYQLPQRTLWSNAERRCLNLLQCKTKSVTTLLQIHAFMLRHSFHNNLNLLTAFITTCASLAVVSPTRHHALVQHARSFFDLVRIRDTFLCNSMIATHFAARQFSEPFTLFRDLRRKTPPFTPDGYTFTSLVKGCSARVARREGSQLHGVVLRNGLCFDLLLTQVNGAQVGHTPEILLSGSNSKSNKQ